MCCFLISSRLLNTLYLFKCQLKIFQNIFQQIKNISLGVAVYLNISIQAGRGTVCVNNKTVYSQ